jgi:cadmium resistance protein CadD (predicted permease)
MIVLIYKIANILAGILLGITALDRLDGESDFFNSIAKKLMPFTTVIGGASLGLGIYFLLGFNHILYNVLAIAAGLLLLTHVLSQIPTIGDTLVKVSKKLMPFKVIVGVALLIMTVLRFLHIHILG